MQKVPRKSDISGVETHSMELDLRDQPSIACLFVNPCNPSKCEGI